MVSQRGIGAIYEMPAECGSLYLQHIGSDATFGIGIAVFADAELMNFRFSILFPVGSAVRQKIIKRVRHSEVPERYKPLRFRYPLGLSKSEVGWMIVEDGHSRKVEKLSSEQVAFVFAFAVNDTALKELFCSGWIEGQPFPTLRGRTGSSGS